MRSVSQEVISVPKEQYLKKASYSEHANTRDVANTSCAVVRLVLSEKEDRSYWVFG
jgi:hypothetical protein